MKLLIVDDEPGLVDQLVKLLVRQRYDVDTAADGEAALNKVFENPYDLVLLDIMLPETEGLTVLMIDNELSTVAHLVMCMELPAGELTEEMKNTDIPIRPKDYWIKIFNDHGKVVYPSDLTRCVNLPLYDKHGGYIVRTTIPKQRLRLDQDGKSEVAFRVRKLRVPVGDGTFIVQIGKPVEKLDEEILDIAKGIAWGLIAAMLLPVFLSYLIAGKVLKPIGIIDRLARQINGKELSVRIPLGKSRDKLYRISKSLNRMFDRLESSFETQKEFVASAAHELKSPLALLQLSMEDCIQQPDLP